MKKLYALISALIVALLVGGVVASPAYGALAGLEEGDWAPALESATVIVDPVVTDESVIMIDWVVVDSREVSQIIFYLEAPDGQWFRAFGEEYNTEWVGDEQRGTAGVQVDGDIWASGEYRVAHVVIRGEAWAPGAAHPATAQVVQSISPFVVAGTAPLDPGPTYYDVALGSFAVASGELAAGDTLEIGWMIESNPWTSLIIFRLTSENGDSIEVPWHINQDSYGADVFRWGNASLAIDSADVVTGDYTVDRVTFVSDRGVSKTLDIEETGATAHGATAHIRTSTGETANSPTRDTVAPLLHSFNAQPVSPQNPELHVLWTVWDDSAVSAVRFEILTPSGSTRTLTKTLGENPPGGMQLGYASADTSDGSWEDGEYTVLSATVFDTAGNVSTHVTQPWAPEAPPQTFIVTNQVESPEPTVTTAPTTEAPPTVEPTVEPTAEPTIEPSTEPSTEPTVEPSTTHTAPAATAPVIAPTPTASVAPGVPAPSSPSGPSGGLATTGVDGSGALALGVGSLVLLAGAALLLLRRRPADQ